ncbi:MAG: hypothetical protein CM15mP12_7710 [Gammaproteobacteria bacterium]|nr:MAG: hypothetical protein CM15mP12_7710 [Gammaproteobacteria bacterium]
MNPCSMGSLSLDLYLGKTRVTKVPSVAEAVIALKTLEGHNANSLLSKCWGNCNYLRALGSPQNKDPNN